MVKDDELLEEKIEEEIDLLNFDLDDLAEEDSGEDFTGMQSIESLFPLSIFFYGIALVMLIYLMVNLILPFVSEKIKDRRML